MHRTAQRASAETIALKALAFLAESPDSLATFMAASGLTAEMLKARAGEPEFLGAVLDFLLSQEELLVAFCEAESLEPRFVHTAPPGAFRRLALLDYFSSVPSPARCLYCSTSSSDLASRRKRKARMRIEIGRAHV